MKGKAKIEFEQWFKNNPQCIKLAYVILRDITHNELVESFYELPQTMQQGVIREFFESKGMLVEIFSQSSKPKLTYGYKVVQTKYDIFDDGFPDYSTAFTHAIDKACEIINGKEN